MYTEALIGRTLSPAKSVPSEDGDGLASLLKNKNSFGSNRFLLRSFRVVKALCLHVCWVCVIAERRLVHKVHGLLLVFPFKTPEFFFQVAVNDPEGFHFFPQVAVVVHLNAFETHTGQFPDKSCQLPLTDV